MIGGRGLSISAEESSLNGRSDVVLTLHKEVYIIEIDVDENAEAAISQIHKKGYADRYINTDKTIHLIGLTFSSKDRQIDSWKEEIFDKHSAQNFLA